MARVGGKSSNGPRIGDSGMGDTDDRGVDHTKDDDPADVGVVRDWVPDEKSSPNSESRLRVESELSDEAGEFGRGGS